MGGERGRRRAVEEQRRVELSTQQALELVGDGQQVAGVESQFVEASVRPHVSAFRAQPVPDEAFDHLECGGRLVLPPGGRLLDGGGERTRRGPAPVRRRPEARGRAHALGDEPEQADAPLVPGQRTQQDARFERLEIRRGATGLGDENAHPAR